MQQAHAPRHTYGFPPRMPYPALLGLTLALALALSVGVSLAVAGQLPSRWAQAAQPAPQAPPAPVYVLLEALCPSTPEQEAEASATDPALLAQPCVRSASSSAARPAHVPPVRALPAPIVVPTGPWCPTGPEQEQEASHADPALLAQPCADTRP